MKYSFPTFSEKQALLESVQVAKDYLLKRYALEKKIKTSEIDEETRKKILDDPKFKEVKDLTEKSPGYTPMFVKFRFEQKAHMDELKEIFDNLMKYKQTLKQDLPIDINDYVKIEPTDEDIRPGYEVLGDDLRSIERKRKLRKLYAELTPRMKKAFAKATDKQIEELTEITNQLEYIKTKKVLESPREQMEEVSAFKAFTWTLKRYDNTRTYPVYRDEKVAFADLIKDALAFAEAWEQDESKLLKNLKELGPMSGLLYAKNGYIVQSARTPEAQRAICADTGWCIQKDITFWSPLYTTGRVQINIYNGNVSVTDIHSLVGITVNPNGSIHTDATRPNNRLRDKNGNTYKTLKDALEGLDYPKDLIDTVMSKFKMECDIKLALERYYKEGTGLTVRNVIESLIATSKGFLAGVMPQEDWENISGLVAQIIAEDKGLNKSDFMKEYKQFGIISDASLNVFNRLIGDDCTKGDIEDILKATEKVIEDIKYVLDLYGNGDLVLKAADSENMRNLIKEEQNIIKKIKAKL
jgi:hypothetical protein